MTIIMIYYYYIIILWLWFIIMSGDPLTMSYFDNFVNRSLNKYIKNFKNGKKFIDVFFYF
jgi:hypothetical protein